MSKSPLIDYDERRHRLRCAFSPSVRSLLDEHAPHIPHEYVEYIGVFHYDADTQARMLLSDYRHNDETYARMERLVQLGREYYPSGEKATMTSKDEKTWLDTEIRNLRSNHRDPPFASLMHEREACSHFARYSHWFWNPSVTRYDVCTNCRVVHRYAY